MSTSGKLPIYWSIPAEEQFQQLDAGQQERVLTLVNMVRTTPSTGAFYGKTPQNRVLQIVTSANAHLVYTVIYVRIGKAILVIDCFIEDWEMDDEAGAPYRT